MSDANHYQFAESGSTIVTGTNEFTGNFFALHIISAAVVSAMTYADSSKHTGDWADLTSIPAGTVLLGKFTSITLASGEAIAYKK